MKRSILKNSLLTLYAITLGFFLGNIFLTIPGLPWIYATIAGYAMGALAGGFISFELFGKWRRPQITKIVTAIILLALIGSIAIQLTLLELAVTKMQLSTMYP